MDRARRERCEAAGDDAAAPPASRAGTSPVDPAAADRDRAGGGGAVDLSWVVVSHQSSGDLACLLPSLDDALRSLAARGLSAELVVVDNASSDGSASVAEALAPRARVVRCHRNGGYGRAVNDVAGSVRGRWLACSNADVVVPPDGLAALPAVLAEVGPRIGVVGPVIHVPALGLEPSVGRFPTLPRLLTGRVRRGARARGGRPRRVDWVTGACLFVRRDVFLGVGGFDERFFLYYEDVDLARRLRDAGWRCAVDARIRVEHRRPHVVRGRGDLALEAVVRESRREYFAAHRPAWERVALGALAGVEARVRPLARAASLLRPASGAHRR